MAVSKLQRFAEMKTFKNVFQPSHSEIWEKDYKLKGKWHKKYFKNNNPITLEVGCGKGEYTVGLARKYPNKNFIGIDIKGARMWRGAKTALKENLNNTAFIRTNVELLRSIFTSGEISEIWITFPDPQMKKIRKRLTSTRFIKLYGDLISNTGIIHLKTDSQFLFQYTSFMIKKNNLKIITETNNLYNSKIIDEKLSIQTYYEQQFLTLGIPIKYLSFMIENKKEFIEPNIEIELDMYKSFGRKRKKTNNQKHKAK